jgi:hypothetical protein
MKDVEKPPVEFDFSVAICVPSNIIVTVEEAANPVPIAATDLPTLPIFGLSEKWDTMVKDVVATVFPLVAVIV